MRFPPILISAGACALAVAALVTPATGAVGDVTTFPTAAPSGGPPTSATLGPDGAVWFVSQYEVDPGVGSASRRASRTRREMGTPRCCSRLIRVDSSGAVSTRGRDLFSSRQIWGLTSAAGSLWVATTERGYAAPFRIWRYETDGSSRSTVVPQPPGDLISGPDGNLWWQVTGGIGRMSRDGVPLPTYSVSISPPLVAGLDVAWARSGAPSLQRISPDGSMTEFPTGVNAGAIAASPDGSVWYSDRGDQAIGRLVPGAGVRESLGSGGAFNPGPITVSADGVAWVVNDSPGAIHRVEPSMAMRTIEIPGASAVISPAIGADGNVWVSYQGASGAFQFARILTGVVPRATRGPTASGKVKAGQVLAVDPGQWAHAPTGYGYAWQRCPGADPGTCTAIPGASSPTYTVSDADAGAGIRALVSATNLNGTSGAVASNMLTGASAPANAITLGRSTRKGYVISTPVTVITPGTIRQFGLIPRTRRSKAVRACTPKPISLTAPGRRVIRCSLSKAVRTRLASKRQTVVLTTNFMAADGGTSAVTRRVAIPRVVRRG